MVFGLIAIVSFGLQLTGDKNEMTSNTDTPHDKDWSGLEGPSDIMTKDRRDQVKDGTINWDEVHGKK